jgi:hypothetical protein
MCIHIDLVFNCASSLKFSIPKQVGISGAQNTFYRDQQKYVAKKQFHQWIHIKTTEK